MKKLCDFKVLTIEQDGRGYVFGPGEVFMETPEECLIRVKKTRAQAAQEARQAAFERMTKNA